jgi:hypothetical protein
MNDETVRTYYHYIFRKTDLGYEVTNTKNNQVYSVTITDQNGMVCTCPAKILGNTRMCKHKKYVIKLFILNNQNNKNNNNKSGY